MRPRVWQTISSRTQPNKVPLKRWESSSSTTSLQGSISSRPKTLFRLLLLLLERLDKFPMQKTTYRNDFATNCQSTARIQMVLTQSRRKKQLCKLVHCRQRQELSLLDCKLAVLRLFARISWIMSFSKELWDHCLCCSTSLRGDVFLKIWIKSTSLRMMCNISHQNSYSGHALVLAFTQLEDAMRYWRHMAILSWN